MANKKMERLEGFLYIAKFSEEGARADIYIYI